VIVFHRAIFAVRCAGPKSEAYVVNGSGRIRPAVILLESEVIPQRASELGWSMRAWAAELVVVLSKSSEGDGKDLTTRNASDTKKTGTFRR